MHGLRISPHGALALLVYSLLPWARHGSVASGSSVVPGVRVPCTCGGEGGRGGDGNQLGHSPSGTIHGEPSPNMQPIQPCLKVGCENSGRWTRMKRSRRNRVKARPEIGRRKGPCPSSDPGSSAVLVSKRHGEGTEAHTGTLSTVAITIGGPGERLWSSLAVWTGAAQGASTCSGEKTILPPSIAPSFSFPFFACNFIRKIELGFPPRKEMSQSVGDRGLKLVQLGSTPAAAVAGAAFPLSWMLSMPSPPDWKPCLPPL